VTVAVVIDKSAARTPAWSIVQQPRLFGYICEGLIPVVTEKLILSKIRTEQIFEAIVVVIAYAYARGPANRMKSGFFGHVGESSVAIVFV
jgi:hypothetical protein